METLAEQTIVDILGNQMDLDSQRVWIRDQNKKIPQGDGLFVIVGMISSKPFSVNKYSTPTDDDTGLKEIQTVIAQEQIQIDIISRNTDAITRRYEILTALNSTYAVQKMEAGNFKIFKMPTAFLNASEAEGGSRINRFSVTVTAHVWYRKEIELASGDFYNDFDTRVDDKETIDEADGLIEFTIDENTDLGGLA
ncbi:hypothetical protein [uncultured Paraglaciecola sp.]|uniref:hypothetical protein n=1 Tax=uncultured Paraglaciecola sp. TaxID=1765024 RepID=UPI00260E9901|nr:hypothetical protein [uncultured Paraglaciecola sp.]